MNLLPNAFLFCFFLFFNQLLSDSCYENKICSGHKSAINFPPELYFYLGPQYTSLQYTVSLDLKLKNLISDKKLPFTFLLKGNEKFYPLTFNIKNNKLESYEFVYTYSFRIGNSEAKNNFVYHLPFSPDLHFRVTQGYDGKVSHKGDLSNSIDWTMPLKTPIYSARKGVIAEIMDGFEEGKFEKEYLDKANYIFVLHDDGTIGNYAHLSNGSVSLKVGDTVNTGDFLGLSGNSGYSSAPHLHFNVFVPKDGNRYRTIPVKFKHFYNKNGEILKEGNIYFHHDELELPEKELSIDIKNTKLCDEITNSECKVSDGIFSLKDKILVYIPIIKKNTNTYKVRYEKLDGDYIKKDVIIKSNLNYTYLYTFFDSSSFNTSNLLGKWQASVYIENEKILSLDYEIR